MVEHYVERAIDVIKVHCEEFSQHCIAKKRIDEKGEIKFYYHNLKIDNNETHSSVCVDYIWNDDYNEVIHENKTFSSSIGR